ncbi:MAG: hypothetical protein M1828_003940 [Chrysothrix sp. TS-e1954]|nr:MAG: hypothetical protein M1828_003940 [Chrysothrix sp. TS-e1954]
MAQEKTLSELEKISNGSLDLTKPVEFLAAVKKLQEVSSDNRTDARVQRAAEALTDVQKKLNYVELVQHLLDQGDESKAEVIRRTLGYKDIPVEQLQRIVDVLLERGHEQKIASDILHLILTSHDDARKRLAECFCERPTEVFNALWALGERGTGWLATIVKQPSKTVWRDEATRIKSEKDAFTLLLAKLFEAGLDHPEIAMKCVALLLTADAANLEQLVDADSFQTILTFLKNDNTAELRSQATLVAAKLLEVSPTRGQRLLAEFVVNRIAQQSKNDLITAFSAAGAIFPVVPSMAAGLFLTEGFIADLINLLSSSGSTKVVHAGLDLLSAACVDKSCREAIAKQCTTWLQQTSESEDDQTSVVAGLILAKTQETNTVHADDLFSLFRSLALKSDDDVNQNAVEGLAFTSIQPVVKEALVDDTGFLSDLADTLKMTKDGQLQFGLLTLFSNLTRYPHRLTAEEKRMAQLKAYANRVKPEQTHPLESEVKVSTRCSKCIDVGIVSALIERNKSPSSLTVNTLVSSIVLALTKHPRHRGKLAQQGAIDLLLSLCSSRATTNDPSASTVRRDAALALAQILISIDPSLIFTPARPATNAIRPLHQLLRPEAAGGESSTSGPFANASNPSTGRDLYAAREALKALTNLATLGAETTDSIVNHAWDDIEAFFVSDVYELRLAAIQLVGNLCDAEGSLAINKLASEGSKSMHRLQVLSALLKGETKPLQLSIAAALVGVMKYEAGIQAFLRLEKGVSNLVDVLRSEEEDQLRGGDDLVYRLAIVIEEMVDQVVPQATRTQSLSSLLATDVKRLLRNLSNMMKTGEPKAAVGVALAQLS